MLTLSLALAALAAAPDTLVRPAPAAELLPAVTVHRQPELPVVALRLSILVDDPAGYAGAGHLFQHLLLPSMEEQVARVGGRVQATRTADAVVYTVVGPASELEYLAGVLRGALRAPAPGTGQLLAALNELAAERDAERETAPAFVRAALRSRVFPAETPPAGTPAAAARMTTARLGEVWAAMYDPDRVSLVAVGDVQADAVQRAFRTLPGTGEDAPVEALADTVPGFTGGAPQATRGWVGMAVPAANADPAALSVAAWLLRGELRRRLPAAEVAVEHWWTHQGQAMVVVAAVPGAQLAAAKRAVAGVLTATGTRVDDESVAVAAQGVRRDMLFFSRTPERMAEVLGSFADRTREPDAAQRFYATLERVDAGAVRTALAQLSGAEPVLVEVPPQRLITR